VKESFKKKKISWKGLALQRYLRIKEKKRSEEKCGRV